MTSITELMCSENTQGMQFYLLKWREYLKSWQIIFLQHVNYREKLIEIK